MRHDDRDEERSRCGPCGQILRPCDSISVAQVGERCYRCFNKELAERLGVDFDGIPIAPIVVTDVDGVRHRFEIRSMLRARLGRIQVRAQKVGWGLSDAVDEVLHAVDARAARVRPGKVDRR